MEKDESFEIIATRITQIQQDLNVGTFGPNISKEDHVVKIITGKGIHSHSAPVLRYQIPTVLKMIGCNSNTIYNNPEYGFVLVRMTKGGKL